MSPELSQVLLTVAVLIVTVMLPVAPTLLLYKLLPPSSVAVSGPFQGLTLKAAGAFAAYFITFVAVTPFAWRTFNIVTAMITPTWTITGQIVAMNSEGQQITDPRIFDAIEAKLEPGNFSAAQGRLWTKIPVVENRIPNIHLTIPQFGAQTIVLEGGPNPELQYERDDGNRTITILSEIYIKQFSAQPYTDAGTGLGTPGTTAPPPPIAAAPAAGAPPR